MGAHEQWVARDPEPKPAQLTSVPLQAKLIVGAPDDRLEHEADRMADEVVSEAWRDSPARATAVASGGTPLQRKCSTCQNEGDEAVAIRCKIAERFGSESPSSLTLPPQLTARLQHEQTRAGRALEPSLRTTFERGFAQDLASVKIHDDGRAAELAQQLRARAFTIGHDVFFNRGEFRPHDRGGQRLIAHELAHVVQQDKSRSTTIRRFVAGIPDVEAEVPAATTREEQRLRRWLEDIARMELDRWILRLQADKRIAFGGWRVKRAQRVLDLQLLAPGDVMRGKLQTLIALTQGRPKPTALPTTQEQGQEQNGSGLEIPLQPQQAEAIAEPENTSPITANGQAPARPAPDMALQKRYAIFVTRYKEAIEMVKEAKTPYAKEVSRLHQNFLSRMPRELESDGNIDVPTDHAHVDIPQKRPLPPLSVALDSLTAQFNFTNSLGALAFYDPTRSLFVFNINSIRVDTTDETPTATLAALIYHETIHLFSALVSQLEESPKTLAHFDTRKIDETRLDGKTVRIRFIEEATALYNLNPNPPLAAESLAEASWVSMRDEIIARTEVRFFRVGRTTLKEAELDSNDDPTFDEIATHRQSTYWAENLHERESVLPTGGAGVREMILAQGDTIRKRILPILKKTRNAYIRARRRNE